MFAGLGCLSALLALGVPADPLALVVLGLAAVCWITTALYGADRRALIRFGAINGLAILLLGWGAFERTDLVIQRTPEQLEVSLNGVRLAASLGGIDSQLNHVSVSLSSVDERPMSAPWMFDSLPWLKGFGDWLAGGMRGGLEQIRVVDANDSNLVPPLVGLWQPSHPGEAPILAGGLDAWQVTRAEDQAVVMASPEIFTNRYQIVATLARPSAQVVVTLTGDPGQPAVKVVAAPDRRLFVMQVQPDGGTAETLVGGPFVYRGSVVGWLRAIFRDLGRAWLVALALVGAARLLAIPVSLSVTPLPHRFGWTLAGLFGTVLGLATMLLAGLVAVYLLDKMPHTVESIAYLFQAQVIAHGGMWAPAPPSLPHFEQAYVAATPDGRWFGVLPYGQSMLLAAGLAFGAPWLVSPIAAGLAVGLTVVLGRATYGVLIGVLAGLLLLFSPFVLMLSGDMLAHPAGLLLTVVMLLGVVTALRGPATLGWLLAGLAMGGLVLTRPLAAVGIGIPLTIALVLSGRNATSRLLLVRALIFALAATPGVFYAAFVNVGLTGSPFLPPLSLWSDLDRIGWGPTVGTRGGHDLASALGNTWANLAVLLRHLYGWPGYLTLALALVPFVLGTRRRADQLLAISVLGLAVAHWLYWSDGIIYGPRFQFETVAALALLTARGAVLLARGDGLLPDERAEEVVETGIPAPAETAVAQVQPRPAPPVSRPAPVAPEVERPAESEPVREPLPVRGGSDEAPLGQMRLSSAPFAVVLVAALFAINLVGYLPELVPAYQEYNGIGPSGLQAVEAGLAAAGDIGLEPALIFVVSEWPDWQSYGQVFLANGPFLDGQVIYARDLGETENWSLMSRYPDRRWWQLKDGALTELRR